MILKNNKNKKYKIVNFIFWFHCPIKVLLHYCRCRSSLRGSLAVFVVNGLPSIVSSVTSVHPPTLHLLSHWSRPQSGQTHLLFCFLPMPRRGDCFISVHRAGLYLPSTMPFLTWFSYIWCALLVSLLIELISSLQGSSEIPLFSCVLADPHQLGGGGENDSSLISL